MMQSTSATTATRGSALRSRPMAAMQLGLPAMLLSPYAVKGRVWLVADRLAARRHRGGRFRPDYAFRAVQTTLAELIQFKEETAAATLRPLVSSSGP